MSNARLQPSVDSASYNRLCRSLEPPPVAAQNHATLELVRRVPTPGQLGADPILLHDDVAGLTGHSLHTHNPMTWTPSATHDGVVRMLIRFRTNEFSLPSVAGKIATVHDSRVPKQRRRSEPVDLESLSGPQVLDLVYNSDLRRKVWCRPEARVYRTTSGEAMHNVIDRDTAAMIVRPRPRRGSGSVNTSRRDWRADVGRMLSKLQGEYETEVLAATDIRIELQKLENELSRVRSAANRLKSGGRAVRNLRRHAVERVSELDSQRRLQKDRLSEITRTKEYRRGMRQLLNACAANEDLELYFFGR